MVDVAPPRLARGASAPVMSSPLTPVSPNPKARRLSGGAQPGRRLSGWRAEDLENLNIENDDEEERKRAAAEVAEEKKRKAAHSPFRATPGHEARKHMYKEQIEQSVSTAFEMHAKNKVSKKNAFGLDFINHMRHAINDKSAQDSAGGTDFAHASATIECAEKIYSYKVDAYREGVNRLLSREDPIAEPDDETEEPDSSEAGQGPKATPKPKAKPRPTKSGTEFIETKPEALNMKKLDVTLSVDPLFKETSAKFDAGGAAGLLLNHLHVRHGLKLAFDSTDVNEQGAEPPAAGKEPRLPASVLQGLLPVRDASRKAHIAQDFSEFWKTVRPCGVVSEQENLLAEHDAQPREEESELEEPEPEPALSVRQRP